MKYPTRTYETSSSAANAPTRSRRHSGASQRAVSATGSKSRTFLFVHRIIFGPSPKPLATELDENPHAVYLTDTQNRTALDWATAKSRIEDMALLIKYGPRCRPQQHGRDWQDSGASCRRSHDVNSLRLILEAGGNPNPTYPRRLFRSSPLTAAGFAGMPTLLKLLLDFEANPNACNSEGPTALHSVARTHNPKCAVLLLEYGADLNAMSNNGRTPLTTAIIHNKHTVLQLFVD
jgi:ankyrin repeat protein